MKLTASIDVAVDEVSEMAAATWVELFAAELKRLPPQVAQPFLDRLELLLSQRVIEVTKWCDSAAFEAGHIGLTIRIVGAAELLAAARAAT